MPASGIITLMLKYLLFRGFLVEVISDHNNLDLTERNEKISGAHGILWLPNPSMPNININKDLLDIAGK